MDKQIVRVINSYRTEIRTARDRQVGWSLGLAKIGRSSAGYRTLAKDLGETWAGRLGANHERGVYAGSIQVHVLGHSKINAGSIAVQIIHFPSEACGGVRGLDSRGLGRGGKSLRTAALPSGEKCSGSGTAADYCYACDIALTLFNR